MIPALTAEQMRAFDRSAIEAGVPGLVLMENAGRGAAELIAARLRQPRAPILILCGPGNNGGDGFVVARRLLTLGLFPQVFLTTSADKLRGDALTNYQAYAGLSQAVTELGESSEPLRVALASAGAVVDALFGTGLDRELTAPARELVRLCNQAAVQRFALDLPTGLHSDTGRVLGDSFLADMTVCFGHYKRGLLTPSGKRCAGELCLVDIGVPPRLGSAASGESGQSTERGQSAELVEPADVRAWLPPRGADLHKGSAGKLSVLGGSAGKSGAALLAARGALRGGAGLVTLCNFPEAVAALELRVVEAMTRSIDPVRTEASLNEALAGQGALVVGPGLGLDSRAKAVTQVALRWAGPKLLDADAISLFAGRAQELANHAGELVLTPHPAELGRLLGVSVGEIEEDRFGAVLRASELCNATVLLKGPYTLIRSPGAEEPTRVNPSGGPALATGGSGDVLSGLIGALLTRVEPQQAALVGAYLHGLAGELWSAKHRTSAGLLASDLADLLPAARASLESSEGVG